MKAGLPAPSWSSSVMSNEWSRWRRIGLNLGIALMLNAIRAKAAGGPPISCSCNGTGNSQTNDEARAAGPPRRPPHAIHQANPVLASLGCRGCALIVAAAAADVVANASGSAPSPRGHGPPVSGGLRRVLSAPDQRSRYAR